MQRSDGVPPGNSSEPWTPELVVPPRPAGVPESAEFAHGDSAYARWEAGERVDGEKHGAWRYWAINGALIMESQIDHGSLVDSKTFRAGAKLASHTRLNADDTTTVEGFASTGERTYRIDLVGPPEESCAANIVSERIFAADGSVSGGLDRRLDDDGTLVGLRELGPSEVPTYETAATDDGGCKVRLFEAGNEILTIDVGTDPSRSTALAPAFSDTPFPIDASGIDRQTRSSRVMRFLPGRLFAATIEATPRPPAVEAFVARYPWAAEIETRSPVAHTSVANLMTALTTSVPYAEAFGRVGLSNMLKAEGRLQEAAATLFELVNASQVGWLVGLLGNVELPVRSEEGLDLQRLLDSSQERVRLAAVQWLGQADPEAVVPYLDDADPAMQTLAALTLANAEPVVARERVVETLRALAAKPAPEALADEFRELVANATAELGDAELRRVLLTWYRDPNGTGHEDLEMVLLDMVRDPEVDVPAGEAAEILRALADRHESIAAPVAAGLGLPRQVRELADRVEREGVEVPSDDAEFQIGEVTLPSGNLVLVDMGALGQWSHEAPHYADLSGSTWADAVGASRGDFGDMRVTGPDAAAALVAFVEAHGTGYLFDVNAPQAERAQEMFAAVVDKKGLDAKLEPAPIRIGHGQRVRMLVEAGLSHAGFSFAHVNAITVHGLPNDRVLPVVGRWTDNETWAYVSLVCRPSEPVSSEKIDVLGVEEARMIFADAEALAFWEHERSADGLIDVVFWGGREDEFAERFGLSPMRGNQYGWTDLPSPGMPDAWIDLLTEASDTRQLAADLRPHSSHHAILRHAWATDFGVGTAEIGGAKMCGLFSSVGDGGFGVYVERDAGGEVCRVTVRIDGDGEG